MTHQHELVWKRVAALWTCGLVRDNDLRIEIFFCMSIYQYPYELSFENLWRKRTHHATKKKSQTKKNHVPWYFHNVVSYMFFCYIKANKWRFLDSTIYSYQKLFPLTNLYSLYWVIKLFLFNLVVPTCKQQKSKQVLRS